MLPQMVSREREGFGNKKKTFFQEKKTTFSEHEAPELSGVVHGTAETLINKLEENLSSAFAAAESNPDAVNMRKCVRCVK
jgi:hypothetical protein